MTLLVTASAITFSSLSYLRKQEKCRSARMSDAIQALKPVLLFLIFNDDITLASAMLRRKAETQIQAVAVMVSECPRRQFRYRTGPMDIIHGDYLRPCSMFACPHCLHFM